jgi:hypothetical protein
LPTALRALLFVTAALAGGCTDAPGGAGSPALVDASTCAYANPVAAAGSGASTSAACSACMGEHCGAELAAYASGSGCGGYLDCACPGTVTATGVNVASSCQLEATSDGCVTATASVDLCADTACSVPCNPSPVDALDAGDASAAALATIDASLSATCSRYATCCLLALIDGGPTATFVAQCDESASLLTDAQCEAYLVAYQDAGLPCVP